MIFFSCFDQHLDRLAKHSRSAVELRRALYKPSYDVIMTSSCEVFVYIRLVFLFDRTIRRIHYTYDKNDEKEELFDAIRNDDVMFLKKCEVLTESLQLPLARDTLPLHQSIP